MPVASRLLSPVGDKSAKYGSIPWHAQIAVEEDRRSKTLTHLCSGVIVSNRFVMSTVVILIWTAVMALMGHYQSGAEVVKGFSPECGGKTQRNEVLF